MKLLFWIGWSGNASLRKQHLSKRNCKSEPCIDLGEEHCGEKSQQA